MDIEWLSWGKYVYKLFYWHLSEVETPIERLIHYNKLKSQHLLMFIHVYFVLYLVLKKKRWSLRVELEMRQYSDRSSYVTEHQNHIHWLNCVIKWTENGQNQLKTAQTKISRCIKNRDKWILSMPSKNQKCISNCLHFVALLLYAESAYE